MMSRVGLELTNFINPDLTWKRVSKGYRTGTRRSRKVTKNWKVGAEPVDNSGKMVEDAETTVSESEKLGVAVLGRRFSDKIEHVPIKKRRFMIRSPSPPPRSYTPPFEESSQRVDSQHSRGQVLPKSIARKQLKSSPASPIKFAHATDFSGIEILAEAACSNSMDNDVSLAGGSLAEESKQEAIDSSTSGVPLEDPIASSDLTSCLQKDILEDKKDNAVTDLQNHPHDMDDGMVKKSASLRDHRLHWDLNVSMDAWEQPPEIDSVATSADDIPMDSRCEIQKEDIEPKIASTGKPVIGSGLVSSDASKDIHMAADVDGSIPETCISNTEVDKIEFCSSLDKNHDKSAHASDDLDQESSMEVAANTKPSVEVLSKDECADRPVSSPADDITKLQMEDVNKVNLNAGIVVEENPEEDMQKNELDVSGLKLGNTPCLDNVLQVISQDVAPPCEAVPKKVACETVTHTLNEVSEDSGKMLALNARSSQERMSAGSCPSSPVPVEQPVCETEELRVDSSVKCEDISASIGEDLHGATADSNGQKDESFAFTAPAKVDSQQHFESALTEAPSFDACNKNGSGSASSSDKVSVDETPVGGFDSDVSQDGKIHFIDMDNNRQDGYDSQFEDGELRETDLCWDNDDGEAEFLDYDSDDAEAFDVDASDYSVSLSGKVDARSECEKEGACGSESENMEKKMKVDRGSNAVTDNTIENGEHLEDALKEPGWPDVSANLTSEIAEDGTIKKHSADCVNGLDMKEVPARTFGSKTSRRPLPESHSSPDMLNRKNVSGQRGRSDNIDGTYPRLEGMAASDKSMGRDRSIMHNRSPGGGHLFNSSGSFRDSKRGHSPTYYGSYNSGRPRPKSVIESRGYVVANDSTIPDGVARIDNRIRRPFVNSSSNGVYRPHVRRRSPSERDDAYAMPVGMVPVRDSSPDRRRFRRYPQGISRGIREEYHRQMSDEATEYPNHLPHRMTRRQRSISPPFGRGPPPHYAQPFKKSRSRSRSRSPIGWLLPRNRNEGPGPGPRHRSRSPDFRSKGSRIERSRLPFQRPGFEPGYEVGFMSPPGNNRFSPPRNSRWFDDRNCGVDHLRGRRSPVRMFRPNQRFDPSRPMRRMNSDDYFRPMIHPGRYTEMSGAGRGRKYEEDDRRKNGERYEVIHRVRRYDSDGAERRFRYDSEDCFVAKSTNNYEDCNRSSDRRPRDVVARRGSEEKDQQQPQQPRLNQDQQQPRFNQDNNNNNKVNNTNPNSLGVLEEAA